MTKDMFKKLVKRLTRAQQKKDEIKTEPPKPANVIDYTTSRWGNAFFINKEKKYGDGFYPKYDWKHRPDEGTIIFKADRENKKVWVARLHNVRWYGNPDDAYTSEYTTIHDESELTEEEVQELNRKLMFLYGFDLNSGNKEIVLPKESE